MITQLELGVNEIASCFLNSSCGKTRNWFLVVFLSMPMIKRIATRCVCWLTVFSMVGQAIANPLGGVVVGGDANATIAGEGTSKVTINQNRDRAIINWNLFSINAGEVTKFIQ